MPLLRAGDRVRLISPSSPADRASVVRFARVLESWGLEVDFGKHVFERIGFLAGTDENRSADLNDALRDPAIRGIFVTRGGKGAYRIADRIHVAAVRRDVGIHGPGDCWAVDQASLPLLRRYAGPL